MTNAVATRQATGSVVALFGQQDQNAVAAYEKNAGVGFEGGKDALKTPFIRLAQGLTAQVESVAGLKAGMYFNTITSEVYKGDEGFVFVPVLFNEKVVEWEGETGKGKFVAQHDPKSDLYKKAIAELPDGLFSFDSAGKIMRPKAPNGNELVHTRYTYGLVLDVSTGDAFPAILAFSSTHTNSWREWYTNASGKIGNGPNGRFPLPPWAYAYRVTAVKKTNEKGTWYVPQVAYAGKDADGLAKRELSSIPGDGPIAAASEQLYKLIKEGAIAADMDSQGDGSDSAGGGGAAKAGADKIPF